MAETERYITSTLNRRDETVEKTLRPQKFEDFPGQDSVKERLKVYVEAAKRRKTMSRRRSERSSRYRRSSVRRF